MPKGKKYQKIAFARTLRRSQTEAEERLWEYLRGKNFFGFKFRRQHIIKKYILDFYCPSAKIAIELDGTVHAKQKDYDQKRQEIIESHGIKVIRFRNHQVLYQITDVIKRLITDFPSPFPMEKGLYRTSSDKVRPG